MRTNPLMLTSDSPEVRRLVVAGAGAGAASLGAAGRAGSAWIAMAAVTGPPEAVAGRRRSIDLCWRRW